MMSYSYQFPVRPTYELLHVLQFNLYMPLKFILFSGIPSRSWLYMVLLVRKAIFKLGFFNKSATLCMSGLRYVTLTQFFHLLCLCGCDFCFLCFRYYFVL